MQQYSWRRNLYAVFIAQIVAVVAFSFAMSFLPLFIRELGDLTNEEAAFWTGIASGGCGLAMFIGAPFWGSIADRWGRKPMLLRAQLSGVAILALMGWSPNVPVLVVLRIIQGFLTGTVAAAQALVATQTPKEKTPFAMGLIMMSFFSGTTFGPLLGGLMADSFGYRMTYFLTAALLAVGTLIVVFFVQEKFERPQQEKVSSLGDMWRLAISREIYPLLITICVIFAAPQMVAPVIPLYIREIDSQVLAATVSGVALGLIGLLAAVSSLVAGKLSELLSLAKMLVLSCFISGLFYLPPIWAGTVIQFIIFVGLTGLFRGGLQTSSIALIGLKATEGQHGVIFGLAQSANSLGTGLGSLIGGSLASLFGLKSVFGVTAGLYVLVGIYIAKKLDGVGRQLSA
jgi:DHA1 family multidrug resistance protein-like MFS transporter